MITATILFQEVLFGEGATASVQTATAIARRVLLELASMGLGRADKCLVDPPCSAMTTFRAALAVLLA